MPHPLDAAIALTPLGEGRFAGATTADYWNMAGPFGGATAAVMLRAVLDHPDCRGRPAALTVNYCGAVAEGAFEVFVRLVRDGRSTQHWSVEQSQAGGGITTTASVVTGAERHTWAHPMAAMPQVARWDQTPVAEGTVPVAWRKNYDMRFLTGGPRPLAPDGAVMSPVTRMWVRDMPLRPVDYPALAAISDAFLPRIFMVRGDFSPVATVTLSTYFLADAAALARQGDRPLLAVCDGAAFKYGFNDQSAQLWSDDGELLAVSNQLVWFKG
ncbi:MAG: acyl-CoA thioesterase [Phenylobacterium zucineum]|nr:MAG: acyl-CoA thioesterase [Phenylobacterium zucineum]